MKMVVLLKEVPDTYGVRTIDPATGLTDRAASEAVVDDAAERGLEVALAYADTHPDTEVTVLTMGPSSATTTIRKALSMGADRGVLVTDDGLAGADLGLTARVLAAALTRIGFDVVLAGNASTDGSGGVVPAMLAEILGVPAATHLDTIEFAEGRVTGRRASDGEMIEVVAPLPAIVSVTERLPEARFPNFKGIRSAKGKPLEQLSLADVAVVADDEGTARSIVVAVVEHPPRSAGIKIVDQGDAGTQLAEYLFENKLA